MNTPFTLENDLDPSALLGTLNEYIWYIAFITLIIAGIYLTIKLKGRQFRDIAEMVRTSCGLGSKSGTSITSVQALCLAFAGKIGVGDIAGVSLAIMTGGPGSLLWIWIFSGIEAIITYAECTLGQLYKEKDKDEMYRGGHCYFLKNGLGMKRTAYAFSIIFLIAYCFMFGSIQANQVTEAFTKAFGIDPLIFAFFLAALSAVMIFIGMKRIAEVLIYIVPFIAGLWLLFAFSIIIINIEEIPYFLYTVISYGLGINAVVGGGLGTALIIGLRRSVFTTDSGLGVMPTLSSSADVKHPVIQGLVQTSGVYIISLLICTSTAYLVIHYAASAYPDYIFPSNLEGGIELVQEAVSSSTYLGSFGEAFIAIILSVFVFTSLSAKFSLAEVSTIFVTKNKFALFVERIAFISMIFIACISSSTILWNLADLSAAFLITLNCIIILKLYKPLSETISDYFRQKSAGIKEPEFDSSILSNKTGVTCWDKK